MPAGRVTLQVSTETRDVLDRIRDQIANDVGFMPTYDDAVRWLASGRGLAEMKWSTKRGYIRRRING